MKYLGRILVSTLALLLGNPAQSDPVKIHIAWVGIPGSRGSYLTEKPELLHHYNQSYTIDARHFSGTSAEITALATGDLDIAQVAYSSLGAAVENAHMEDIRLIADELQDGVPGYATTKFMVLKDSPIQTIEDLRGKVLATNGVGGGVDIAMRAILRNHGLQEQRDYQDVEVAFPNMLAALSAKRVDMIGAVASIQYNPNLQAVARPLFTAGGELGPSESLMWAARAPYIQQNRPALVDFLEDTLRVQRWYLDVAHHGEAIGIIARLTKQKPEDIDWYFTEKDFYRDPNGRPDLDSVAKDLKIMRSIGLLKTDIDAAKYADLSLVKEAANRLKP